MVLDRKILSITAGVCLFIGSLVLEVSAASFGGSAAGSGKTISASSSGSSGGSWGKVKVAGLQETINEKASWLMSQLGWGSGEKTSESSTPAKVYSVADNSRMLAGASAIPLTTTRKEASTSLGIGAASNYKIIQADGSETIQDEEGTQKASQYVFSGPTNIAYGVSVVDQGKDAPNYMWLHSPLTVLSVLNSNEASHSLKINDQGEGIYTASQGGITQSLLMDSQGALSGIVINSKDKNLNIAVQNDKREIFGNVSPGDISFECNNKYGISYDSGIKNMDVLMLHPSYDGSVIGTVPVHDKTLGNLTDMHITQDSIIFTYDTGTTKTAEDFLTPDKEYWFGGNGLEVVPKGHGPY